MSKIQKAVQWAIDTANDNRYGYSQASRWGPDYDCSSFVISAWEAAGVPVKAAGASYTGNMRGAFLACGFVDVTTQIGLATGYGIQPGDVLLNYSAHTCLAVGGGKVANCRTSEGNPQAGDQSGNEIRIQSYWNFPWNCVLRYKGDNQVAEKQGQNDGKSEADAGGDGAGAGGAVSGSDTGGSSVGMIIPCPVTLTLLRQGSAGVPVERMQTILIARGYYCGGRLYSGREQPDGEFGPATEIAVRDLQAAAGISQDGVVGSDTWTALIMK